MARPSRLSNNKQPQLQQLIAQARQAYQTQRYDMCETLCKRIDAMHSGDADVANLRGGMCLAVYGIDEALPFFIAAAKAAPKRFEFQANLGGAYLQGEEFHRAFEAYSNALNIKPGELLVLIGCCRALISLGRISEAESYLRLAQGKSLHLQDEFLQMSAICADLNHMDEAISLLEELQHRFPDYANGYFQKAIVLLQAGNEEGTMAEIIKGLELQPYHAKALGMMAEIRKFASPDDPTIKMLREAIEHGQHNQEDLGTLNIAMGRAMQKLGNYDASFECFRKANEMRLARSNYCLLNELKHLDAVMQSYTADVFERHSDIEDESPVFIVGMPRCGSTLVEQILVSHPNVCGRGETGMFEAVLFELTSTDSPSAIEDKACLSPEEWREVGRLYLERLRATGLDTKRIVDKSLENIRLAGAIHCALPHAHIIHLRRNPLDTCLSIYTSDLQGSYHDYGRRLEMLGAYYRKYQQLMQHWRDALPDGVMYELDYEQLVANQEEETRKLLDYCGLDWNDDCMNFQQADTRVNTASIVQVRQAINTRSVERWRPYEKHLQPLIRILGAG